ncbi:MAG: hypothetical protein Q4P33_03840 [Flaviflexus sp.]|nr:hypothetical protein [Flaviflexus sp.]
MAKKKSTGVVVWVGIAFFCLAGLADVVAFFTDDYARNMLYSVPLWFIGFACFVILGSGESKKSRPERHR